MAWLVVMPLAAQGVSFGVKGGLDVVKMEFDNMVFDKSNRTGYFIGPTLVISTFVPGLAIDVSALYDQRTLKVDDEPIEQKSILLPAHARYGASIMGFGSVYLCAGPQLSFNVGPSKYYWEDMLNNSKYFILQDTKLSMDFGLGCSIGHIEANIYYNIPIGKTADFTWNEFNSQVSGALMNSTKTTANSWMLSVSYMF